MKLGKKITSLRKNKKITQEYLAEILGVTRQTISNWELNVTKPDINQIKQISSFFHISIDELLDNDIKNLFIEKANKTEKTVYKNTKSIKILVVTIYFIILLSLIFITIYFLTQKDFTTDYQTEFICESKEEKYKIELDFKDYYDTITTNEEYIDSIIKTETFIKLSKYNIEKEKYEEQERYYAGKSISDIFNGLEIIKKVMIRDYHTKCR